MSNLKEGSKRQLRREQMRRTQMRSRYIAIGIITFPILYLPFGIRDWYTRSKLNKEISASLDRLLK